MEAPDLLKRVAAGKIPIAFDMHDSEVTSLHRPPAFYVMAPRQSYLPLVARSARESFEEAAPDVGESGVWFEHKGKPLRWNIPIGVLYDYYHTAMCSEAAENGEDDPAHVIQDLPFSVTIRFAGFPKLNLLPYNGEVDAESAFFHSMKQALCLSQGSAKRLMEMPKTAQENLWEGIVFNKFDRYWQSCQLLASTELPENSRAPVRVLITGIQGGPEVEGSSPGVARALQASVRMTPEITLKQAVVQILRSNGVAPEILASFENQEDQIVDNDQATFLITIQGVSVPFNAPLREVYMEMSAHDLFLYVVIGRRRK